MALYVIGFDVHNQRNKSSIAGTLGKLGAVCPLESFWLLNSGNATAQLRDELQTSIEYQRLISNRRTKSGRPLGISQCRRSRPRLDEEELVTVVLFIADHSLIKPHTAGR